eukprot:scaffold204_cov166-Alexandrium_tamarense.AAC.6
MVQASAVVHTGASSRTDESGTFSIATWNIRSGRAGGLESACRALGALNVDIGFLQETKLTGGVYTRQSSGYQVIASDASSNRQGGVALCWKEQDSYELEEWKFFGPNVLAFRLVTGGKDFYCVGCYIPPSEEDQSTLENVRRAQRQCPEKFELLLFGGLNIDLDAPRDTREEIIAEQCDYWKLTCMTTMFKLRRTRQMKGDGHGGSSGWVDGCLPNRITSWLTRQSEDSSRRWSFGGSDTMILTIVQYCNILGRAGETNEELPT